MCLCRSSLQDLVREACVSLLALLDYFFCMWVGLLLTMGFLKTQGMKARIRYVVTNRLMTISSIK